MKKFKLLIAISTIFLICLICSSAFAVIFEDDEPTATLTECGIEMVVKDVKKDPPTFNGKCGKENNGRYKFEYGACYRCGPTFILSERSISYVWYKVNCSEHEFQRCVEGCYRDFPHGYQYNLLVACIDNCFLLLRNPLGGETGGDPSQFGGGPYILIEKDVLQDPNESEIAPFKLDPTSSPTFTIPSLIPDIDFSDCEAMQYKEQCEACCLAYHNDSSLCNGLCINKPEEPVGGPLGGATPECYDCDDPNIPDDLKAWCAASVQKDCEPYVICHSNGQIYLGCGIRILR